MRARKTEHDPPRQPCRRVKMHRDEVHIEADLVKRLLAEQLPDLADLKIEVARSMGTVNALYRVGADYCARLPRVRDGVASLARETQWLPRLAPHLSLGIPEPIAIGGPGHGYPFPWAIYRWLEGQPYEDGLIDDESQAAEDLARFVMELRAIDLQDGAPTAGRLPLRELDARTRMAITSAGGVVDSEAAMAAWERNLEAPAWDATPVWIHADLLRPNLLVDRGKLSAVIDFGAVGVGDPAADVIPAWSVFGSVGREVFRDALGVDEGTWMRARGFALHQAALIIPYYADTNPGFVALARRTVEQVIANLEE